MWRKNLETSLNVSFLKWVSRAVSTNVKETAHFEKGFPLWWKFKEFTKFLSSSLETSLNVSLLNWVTRVIQREFKQIVYLTKRAEM